MSEEKNTKPLFRVVAVNLWTGVEREMKSGLTEENAEAFVKMAVIRRGVETEIFKSVPMESQP